MKFLLAILVVSLISAIDAQGPRGGGRRGGRGRGGPGRGRGPPAGVDVSRWNRTIDGQDIRQGGYVDDNGNVFAGSRDRALFGLGRVPVRAMYDFSGASVVVAVSMGPACVVLPGDFESTVTSLSASEEISNRNGTTIAAPSQQVQLTVIDAQEPASVSQAITDFCGRRRVVQAVAADAATFPAPGAEAEGQRVLTFDTLYTDVQMLAPARRPRGPGGPGGNQGGAQADQGGEQQGPPRGQGGRPRGGPRGRGFGRGFGRGNGQG